MKRTTLLNRAQYSLAFLLVALPLARFTFSVFPFHTTNARWRFMALGNLSNITALPLVGLALSLVAATVEAQRRARLLIGWTAGILALALLLAAGRFTLDFFQVRANIDPPFQHTLAVATTTAILKDLAGIVVLFLISAASLNRFGGHRRMTERLPLQLRLTP